MLGFSSIAEHPIADLPGDADTSPLEMPFSTVQESCHVAAQMQPPRQVIAF